MCTPRELSDGTYTIDDLADMHEALNFRQETLAAMQRQAEKSRK